MLINLSNHPSNNWAPQQMLIAKNKYGSISDLAFPAIDPNWNTEKVTKKAEEYFNKITVILDQCANEPKQNAVHIQGEFTFVYQLVSILKKSNIQCIASTSSRNVVELKNGEKMVKFTFVQFREY